MREVAVVVIVAIMVLSMAGTAAVIGTVVEAIGAVAEGIGAALVGASEPVWRSG